MIKNFLFRPTSANMLHHPFVQNIKNEGHVVESLKKHLTGIIKKRQKKGKSELLSKVGRRVASRRFIEESSYKGMMGDRETLNLIQLELRPQLILPDPGAERAFQSCLGLRQGLLQPHCEGGLPLEMR